MADHFQDNIWKRLVLEADLPIPANVDLSDLSVGVYFDFDTRDGMPICIPNFGVTFGGHLPGVGRSDQDRDHNEGGSVHEGTIGTQIVHYKPETGYNTSKANRGTSSAGRSQRGSRGRKTAPRTRLIGLDQKPMKTVYRDDAGKIQGEVIIYGRTQVARSPFDPESKRLTAETRRVGACARCRRGKIRCTRSGDYELCVACVKSVLPQMPCLLVKITDIALFRLQPSADNPLHTWGFRKQVYSLEDMSCVLAQPRKIQITQDVGIGATLCVFVTLFTPEPEDKTGYVWQSENGVNRMEMPHFCLTNIEEARRNMDEYVQRYLHRYIELALSGSDAILRDTFAIAARMYATSSGSKSIVRKALDLWAVSRVIEKTWRICGEDKLGLEAIVDPANPWDGIIPVTPTMDTQLDQIVIKGILVPLRIELLQELQKKISEYGRANWFEIYLTTFILLSNTESILAHSREFARRYGMGGRYGYPGQYASSEGFFHAAKTMLAHFHFVSKGYLPLSLDWASPKAAAAANLDAEQAEYMNNVKEQMREKEGFVLDLRSRHKYEADLYWCHQMFFERWEPGLPHIKEEDIYEQASPVRCEIWRLNPGGDKG